SPPGEVTVNSPHEGPRLKPWMIVGEPWLTRYNDADTREAATEWTPKSYGVSETLREPARLRAGANNARLRRSGRRRRRPRSRIPAGGSLRSLQDARFVASSMGGRARCVSRRSVRRCAPRAAA